MFFLFNHRALCLDKKVILTEDYNLNEAPAGPVSVNFSVYLFNIFDINEPEQRLTMDVSSISVWKDPRVRLDLHEGAQSDFWVLNRNPTERLWVPDIYIKEAIGTTFPILDVPSHFLRIYNDSTIYMSKRIVVDLGCQMTFGEYPVDVQACPVLFESYSLPDKIMEVDLNLDYTFIDCNVVLNQHDFYITLNNSISKEYKTGKFSTFTYYSCALYSFCLQEITPA